MAGKCEFLLPAWLEAQVRTVDAPTVIAVYFLEVGGYCCDLEYRHPDGLCHHLSTSLCSELATSTPNSSHQFARGQGDGGGLWPNPPLLSAFLAWRQAGVGEGVLDPRVLSATHSSLSWPCNYTLQNAPGLTPSPKARAWLGGAADPTMPTYRLEAREGSCPSAAAGSGGSWELQSASLKAKRACTPFRQPESIPRQFHNLPCNADLDNFLRMHFLK